MAKVSGKAAGAGAAVTAALAIAYLLAFDFEGGFVHYAYPDPASPLAKATRSVKWGKRPAAELLAALPPKVRSLSAAPWTWCAGHTGKDFDLSRNYSDAECEVLLQADLKVAQGHVDRCIPGPKPAGLEGGLIDATLNLGPKVVCGSTLQRKAQAGDWRGVCDELGRWNRAGGQVMAGLTRRRSAERNYCEGKPHA